MKRPDMKNPFNVSQTIKSPVITISLMCLMLGVMTTSAIRTNRARADIRRDPNVAARLDVNDNQTQEEVASLRREVSKLREENTKFQAALSKETDQAKVIYESAENLKLFAGLTEVVGPGVRITLRDAPNAKEDFVEDKIIHDTDILKVVNELWNAGAEAVSVNNNRVALGTNFRCVGSTILVDSVRIASPIVIQALGDAKSLKGAIEMPGGIHAEITAIDPRMMEIVLVDKMMLPAYSGSTEKKHVKTVEVPK
ncbi:MAG: DUF881 domain-containing protein [Chthonomonas sp.]|nr:DUF881 domain-containing protein [Chthonomonas sp.]